MENMRFWTAMATLLLSWSISEVSLALEKPEKWGAEQGKDITLPNAEQEKSLDSAQEQASALVDDTAHWIDKKRATTKSSVKR